jgi:glycosyltransferase involved in cell wall biosynthesis
MRILYYTETALPKIGGQELVVDALARQFLELGHDITVLTQYPRWRYRRDDTALPYPVVRHLRFFSTRYFVDSYRFFLRRLLRRARPAFDVLHCHGLYPSGYMAAILKPQLGLPFVLTSHGGDVYADGVRLRKPVLHERHQRAVRAADRLIAISSFTRDGFLRLGARDEQLVEIPNGVHLDELTLPAKRPDELDGRIEAGRYLLYIGRLARRKGVDVLLRALARVAGDVRLVVAGSGVERQNLEELARALGVGERVVFVGAVHGANKAWLFQNTLGTIVPSRMSEAFGLVVLESYATGKPVVAARHPGLASLVREGETGWLVPPESPEAMAAAIEALLADAPRRGSMGEAGRRFVQGFTWRAVARRHVELYEQLSERSDSSTKHTKEHEVRQRRTA